MAAPALASSVASSTRLPRRGATAIQEPLTRLDFEKSPKGLPFFNSRQSAFSQHASLDLLHSRSFTSSFQSINHRPGFNGEGSQNRSFFVRCGSRVFEGLVSHAGLVNLSRSNALESVTGVRFSGSFHSQTSPNVNRSSNLKVCSKADDSVAPTSRNFDPNSSPYIVKMRAQALEKLELQESLRPLSEYMSLPVSQYSVLDAKRIERVDENTFKCYIQEIRFFAIQVIPVLLVRVEQKSNGCQIKLLSCSLDGSPVVNEQNDKFKAFMENNVAWQEVENVTDTKLLVSNTIIEVVLEVPFAFRFIPNEMIESTGNTILSQILRLMLPRFLTQLSKDYKSWASGDESRKPLGTGEI